MKTSNSGAGQVAVLQGNVRIGRADGGPVTLTAGPGYLSTGDLSTGAAPDKTVVRVPMDLATLRVSVTPSGTVFEDGRGDKLTVETGAAPSPSR